MDKKDTTKAFKYSFVFVILMLIGLFIGSFVLFSLINFIFNGRILDISSFGDFIFALIIFVVLFLVIGGFIFVFLKIRKKRDILVASEYIRDLPKYFPPAIASFLLDLDIEITTDYTATIAYLISNKYIKIENGQLFVINSNLSQLSKHEIYVFNSLMGNFRFDNQEFIKLVMEDASLIGVIEKKRRKIHFFRNFLLALFSSIIFATMLDKHQGTDLYQIFAILTILSGISIFFVIFYSIYLLAKYQNENFTRTKKGKIETLKWAGLKKYFNDFTLMDNKSLEDIKLYDNYIPYAIALGEAKSIEKFIDNNNSYRELIYGKGNNFFE